MSQKNLRLAVAFAFLCSLFASVIVSDASASNLADNLVLYLDFENTDGEEVIDESGNNNNGAILGNVEQAEGKIGQGMKFGGTPDDHIKVEDSDSLDITDVYTAMVWANFIQIAGDRHQTFFDKGCQETNPGGGRLLKQMDGTILWQVTNKGVWLPWVGVQPAPLLEIEKWYHFAVARDEKGVTTVYKDGEVLASSQSDDFDVPANDENLRIGGSTLWGNSNMFIGTLDEFVIYNGRALNSDEIKLIMEDGINAAAVDSSGKLAASWGKIKVSEKIY